MKKQKSQRSISTKYKNVADFLAFIGMSVIVLSVVYITTPKTADPLTIVLFILLIIPTIIALVSGAPFVPTPMHIGRKMLEIGKIKQGEKVVDIGCGDGRLVYMAANEFGAKAIGYELSPVVYAIAKVRQLLWRSKAKIKFGDFRMHNLSDVDCIVTYMLPDTLKKFIPKFERELKSGSKIISYAFKIGDWQPIHVEPSSAEENRSKIFVYEIGKQAN
ncbi:hypothetical protein C0416_00500 [bacterium]|nr:hypothetical protein [bacterium]